MIMCFLRWWTDSHHHVLLPEPELRSDAKLWHKSTDINIFLDAGIFQGSIGIGLKRRVRNYLWAHVPCRTDESPTRCELIITHLQTWNAQANRRNELGS